MEKYTAQLKQQYGDNYESNAQVKDQLKQAKKTGIR